MIQEYLLLKNDEIKAIKECKPNEVKLRSFSANKGKCRYVQFSVEGDNEEVAKTLSKLDDTIREKFHVTILESGCAAYFNKRLYPTINNFEIKLRKLLYLTSAINKKDNTNKNITNLETQDFGSIFSMFFIDNNFMNKVKEHIKSLNQEYFVKTDILSFIEAIEEKTLWDKLLGENAVPTLRNRFNDIRVFRNDVMHSHLINWERYRDIQELYNTVNSELDKALLDIEIVESKAPSRPDFNSALEQALKIQEDREIRFTDLLQSGYAEMLRRQNLYATNPALSEYQQHIAEICKAFSTNSKLAEYQKQAVEICKAFSTNPELLKVQQHIAEMNKQFQNSPVVKALQEQSKLLADIKYAIPPALQSLQELSSIAQATKTGIPSEMLKLQKSLAALEKLNENSALHEINKAESKLTDGGKE